MKDGVILDKLLNLSVTQFSHRWNGDKNSPYVTPLFWRLNELISTNFLPYTQF